MDNFGFRMFFRGNYRVLSTENYESVKGETSLLPGTRAPKQAVSFETPYLASSFTVLKFITLHLKIFNISSMAGAIHILFPTF